MDWKNKTGKGISIAVLDSGIDLSRREFRNCSVVAVNDCNDEIGHGTAVASILARMAPDAQLYCYKLFDATGGASSEALIDALTQLTAERHFDIIHLSCSVVVCDDMDGLFRICRQITDAGTVIVAAFDNEGAVSYPAAFDNVIGVDWSTLCLAGEDYIFLEDSAVNIQGVGALQRLPWRDGSYKAVAGASFAAPYISSIAAKMLEAGVAPKDILHELNQNARRRYRVNNTDYHPQNQALRIHKAIAFPFNKEIQTLSLYEDQLVFSLADIYDLPQMRNVVKTCSEIMHFGNSGRTVQSYKKIEWTDDFDTLILGHLDEISSAFETDFLRAMLEKCVEFKKNVYAFDPLTNYPDLTEKIRRNGNFAFYPKADKSEISCRFLDKLFGIATPVVGVFGTSPKQGKYSLQLAIRRKMTEIGYKVGFLGTEPTALLFGADLVFPFGYNGVHVSDTDSVLLLNQYMHQIDRKGYDIIITGSQSQTVPYNLFRMNQIPTAQYAFFVGTNPDAVILCINAYDEIDYVRRTVGFLNSYLNSRVVALSLFPKSYEREWTAAASETIMLSSDEAYARKEYYSSQIGIPCFVSGDEAELEKLVDHLTDFFVEE